MRAVVSFGGRETSYLRAGRGAVLLLLMAEYDGPVAMERISLLSATNLVIAPRVPPDGVLESWLGNVMDGLGIWSASVAAEPALMGDVTRFAEGEDGRVRRIMELAPSGVRDAPLSAG